MYYYRNIYNISRQYYCVTITITRCYMTISKGRKVDPPVDSVPTYIRLTRTQLKMLDRVVKIGHYATRSEAVRTAVTRMFESAYTKAEEREERRNIH